MKLRQGLGLIFALWVWGCASGGSGSGGSTTSTGGSTTTTSSGSLTSTTPNSAAAAAFRTQQYLRAGDLDQINAANAYALGYSGQGVTIGIVDFNFNFTNTQVNYSSASVGPSTQAEAWYLNQSGASLTTEPHGEAVASIAAAQMNNAGTGILGVAYGAQVLAVDYFSDVDDTEVTQNGVIYHVSDPFTYLTSRGVKIINISYGYESGGATLGTPAAGIQTYAVVSPAQGIINGALVVAAAGNAGGSNPSQSNYDIINALPSGTLTNGPGGFIIAGAVDSNNQIASYSDQAGSLMNYYMVAPANNLTVPWNAPGYLSGYATASGTSFAAPQIAGAAALLLQRWPYLTGLQLADILLDTATDLGAPGVDPVYGHGLLNVYAALQPNGVTTFAVAGSETPAVASSAIMLSPIFGDAAQLRADLSDVMIIDRFGRGFDVDASNLVGTRPNIPDLLGIVEQRFGWDGADFAVSENTSLSFDILRTPADDVEHAFNSAGPDLPAPQAMFRLTGASGEMNWSVGRGLSLSDALSPEADDVFAATSSLTGAFSPLEVLGTGNFATFRMALSPVSGFSFGIYGSMNDDQIYQLSIPYHDNEEAAALRFDESDGASRYSVEMGLLSETGGMLGSLASGGLDLAGRSAAGWTTLTDEVWLDEHWTLKGSATLAVSGETHPQGSVISEIGTVYATSFALGMMGNDVWQEGDRLSFTLSQPLRAESAPVLLDFGIGQDPNSGATILGEVQSSLVPSGREVDLETSYRWWLGDWAAEGNFAYRIDPDDERGAGGFVALATLSRKF